MAKLWTEDTRLAALYDIKCAGRQDHNFYLDLARDLNAGTVLDVGCGTGVFALDLAERGHKVVGVDPAAAMLDIARRRPGGDVVTWIEGLVSDVPTATADLIVMMGHVAQYFVSDVHWNAALTEIRRVLASGGHLTFETRNPHVDWAHERTRSATTRVYPHPDGGEFTSWVEVIETKGRVDSYLMTHESHTMLPDGLHLQATETLRFRSYEEIADSLSNAGFSINKTWGDWDKSPRTNISREHIVLAS